MTNLSFYLDFIIALVFILAICSNIMSVCFEAYAYIFKLRGKFLKNIIEDVLNEPIIKEQVNLAELFYNNPLIDLTKKNYRQVPSYISSSNFAQTLIDILIRRTENKATSVITNISQGTSTVNKAEPEGDRISQFASGLQNLPHSDLKILLEGFLKNSGNDIVKMSSAIETWYNEYMNRASGWYKMIVQKKMFLFSVVIAIVFNMDFFRVSTSLLSDRELTKEIVKAAEKYKPDSKDKNLLPPDTGKVTGNNALNMDSVMAKIQQDLAKEKELLNQLYEINAPIGWEKENPKHLLFWDWVLNINWLVKILGFLITALALSFGAPFWFDLLSKLINIRKAGLKPKTN